MINVINTTFNVSTQWTVSEQEVNLLDLSALRDLSDLNQDNLTVETRLMWVAKITGHRVSYETELTPNASRVMIYRPTPIKVREMPRAGAAISNYTVSCRLPSMPLGSEGAVEQLARNLTRGMEIFESMAIAEGDIRAIEAVQVYMEKAVNETISNSFGQEITVVCHRVDIEEWVYVQLPTASGIPVYTIWKSSCCEAM
ncbi:MAG: hypothetical protein K6T83_04685 [Alicyclobacillus sp.]|nr:hypothetical protein [Alicyclobacillus sp.]